MKRPHWGLRLQVCAPDLSRKELVFHKKKKGSIYDMVLTFAVNLSHEGYFSNLQAPSELRSIKTFGEIPNEANLEDPFRFLAC